MKPMDLFLFDLDGTLAATGEDLVRSVNYALNAVGFAPLASETIIGFVGDGIRELMRRALGPKRQVHLDAALDLFSDYYTRHATDFTILYPGVKSCLDYYKHKQKIVLTNKRQIFAEKVLDELGISCYFEQIVGGDAYPYMKPDPRLVHPLLEKFQITPQRTVMIGDGRNDILLANNAGIVSCAFLGGLTNRDILLAMKPDFTCESLDELPLLFN